MSGPSGIRRFATEASGAALVEFALVLPFLLIVSFVSIDGMRLMWAYQAATAGAHEAARYLARVAPPDLCDTGGSLAGYETTLRTLVGTDPQGRSVFSRDATVTAVRASLTCVTDASLRQARVPVATVSADLRLNLPLHGILQRIAGDDAGTLTTRIEEQARVFGL